jgi:teichuronic acid biosynthesis glycosyltransferase TuaC
MGTLANLASAATQGRRAVASVLMVTVGEDSRAQEISSFVKSQAESLRQQGCAVSLGLIDDRTSVGGILDNLRRLRHKVAELKPDVVHAQYGSVVAAIADRARGTAPLVVSFCGADLLGAFNLDLISRARDVLARRISLNAAAHAQAIIVKSQNLLESLPQSCRARAVVLPNGVDTGRFHPMDQQECRTRLKWGGTGRIVLFNGSKDDNQRVKNLPLAKEVMARLRQNMPDAQLRVISDAAPEEVPAMLNAADCVLVTSLSEGSPNIVKEAMACNTPVVAVACGDVPQRLARVHPGSICSYHAPVLADALEQVLRSGKRSNGQQELMAQGLSAQQVSSRLREIYAGAAERRGA